jgi:hypothetical protein
MTSSKRESEKGRIILRDQNRPLPCQVDDGRGLIAVGLSSGHNEVDFSLEHADH